jgi:hypothetical protein
MHRRTLLALPALALLPRPLWAETAPIKLRDLYNKDLSFSDLARGLQDQTIQVAGFMAPPLRADSTFFVLTKMPMSTCPFCETSVQWPDDILAIYTQRIYDVIPFNVPISVQGTLRLTDLTDPDTGFFSRVQLTDARVSRG